MTNEIPTPSLSSWLRQWATAAEQVNTIHPFVMRKIEEAAARIEQLEAELANARSAPAE